MRRTTNSSQPTRIRFFCGVCSCVLLYRRKETTNATQFVGVGVVPYCTNICSARHGDLSLGLALGAHQEALLENESSILQADCFLLRYTQVVVHCSFMTYTQMATLVRWGGREAHGGATASVILCEHGLDFIQSFNKSKWIGVTWFTRGFKCE